MYVMLLLVWFFMYFCFWMIVFVVFKTLYFLSMSGMTMIIFVVGAGCLFLLLFLCFFLVNFVLVCILLFFNGLILCCGWFSGSLGVFGVACLRIRFVMCGFRSVFVVVFASSSWDDVIFMLLFIICCIMCNFFIFCKFFLFFCFCFDCGDLMILSKICILVLSRSKFDRGNSVELTRMLLILVMMFFVCSLMCE